MHVIWSRNHHKVDAIGEMRLRFCHLLKATVRTLQKPCLGRVFRPLRISRHCPGDDLCLTIQLNCGAMNGSYKRALTTTNNPCSYSSFRQLSCHINNSYIFASFCTSDNHCL